MTSALEDSTGTIFAKREPSGSIARQCAKEETVLYAHESGEGGIDRRWESQVEAEEAALAAEVQALRSDVVDQGSRFASLPKAISAVQATIL